MAALDDDQFDVAGSGASDTVPAQCSSLRKNGHVVIKGRPCKIVEMSTSKTGKHGHAKVHLVGIDIFNGKKFEDICPSTHNINVPTVTRKDYILIDISKDGFFTLMDDKGELTKHLKLTDQCACKTVADVQALREKAANNDEDVTVNVVCALGEEMAKELRITK